MSYRGASLRLAGDTIRISSDDVSFPPEFGYAENTEFLRFFVLAYTKLLCDSPLLQQYGDKPASVYMRFFRKLTQEPLIDTIKLFSSYSHEILSNEYSTGGDSSTRVFHPFMIDTPVFKEYHQWIKTGQPELMRYVQTFLLFGKKLDYTSSDFNSTAFRGWEEVEEKLRTLTFGENDVMSLSNIISALLPPCRPDYLLPKFGPGNVAERGVRDVYDKLGSLKLHPRIAYAFFRERPGRSRENGFTGLTPVDTQGAHSRDFARQKFVPKDIRQSRTISMEPNIFMYFQQEVMRWLVSSMESGRISRYVSLRDQTRSQSAAIHGSTFLSTDTIDLSSASDSVSVELVRRIFHPSWLFYLMATRTSRVEIPGEPTPRRMAKFAPMGSALCFPVQCIIFTAISVYAAIAVKGQESTGERVVSREETIKFLDSQFHVTRSPETPFTGRFEPPVVYGDDIAVDTRTTDEVITTLNRLGFTVNRSKSFTGSQSVRESCGVFALEGQDITPMLLKIPSFKKGKFDAQTYASFMEYVNVSRDNGLHHLATFLLSILKDYGFKYPLPFVTEKEGFGIYTTTKHRPADAHTRWNADWQTTEERVQGIEPRNVKKAKPGNLSIYEYTQWWRSRVRGHTNFEESRSSRIRPQETRLAPRWARCE